MVVVKVCYSCITPLNFPSSPDCVLISSLIPQLSSQSQTSPTSIPRLVALISPLCSLYCILYIKCLMFVQTETELHHGEDRLGQAGEEEPAH